MNHSSTSSPTEGHREGGCLNSSPFPPTCASISVNGTEWVLKHTGGKWSISLSSSVAPPTPLERTSSTAENEEAMEITKQPRQGDPAIWNKKQATAASGSIINDEKQEDSKFLTLLCETSSTSTSPSLSSRNCGKGVQLRKERNGEIIREFTSYAQAAEVFSVSTNTVKNWCHSNSIKQGYWWTQQPEWWERAVEKLEITTAEVIQEFKSVLEASKTIGVQKESIFNCLCGRRKTCGRFFWRYKGSNELPRKLTDQKKPVEQLTLKTGAVIAEYESVRKAAASVGTFCEGIRACSAGRSKSCVGYFWRYKGSSNLPYGLQLSSSTSLSNKIITGGGKKRKRVTRQVATTYCHKDLPLSRTSSGSMTQLVENTAEDYDLDDASSNDLSCVETTRSHQGSTPPPKDETTKEVGSSDEDEESLFVLDSCIYPRAKRNKKESLRIY